MVEKLRVVPVRRQRDTPDYIKKILNQVQANLLKKEFFIRAPASGLDQIIEARIKGKVYLLKRMVRCGKGCGGCPHGPYWYGYYRHKGSFVSFYIGADLEPRFREAERIHIHEKKGGEKE